MIIALFAPLTLRLRIINWIKLCLTRRQVVVKLVPIRDSTAFSFLSLYKDDFRSIVSYYAGLEFLYYIIAIFPVSV